MGTRHDIEDAIERWRDDCARVDIDVTALYDPNLVKDLAREILFKLMEIGALR